MERMPTRSRTCFCHFDSFTPADLLGSLRTEDGFGPLAHRRRSSLLFAGHRIPRILSSSVASYNSRGVGRLLSSLSSLLEARSSLELGAWSHFICYLLLFVICLILIFAVVKRQTRKSRPSTQCLSWGGGMQDASSKQRAKHKHPPGPN
jgi:hypothetical protein